MPEQLRRVVRALDEVWGGESAAALEHADALPRLGQPARGYAPSEPGANDHDVVRPLHGPTLTSQHGLRQRAQRRAAPASASAASSTARRASSGSSTTASPASLRISRESQFSPA